MYFINRYDWDSSQHYAAVLKIIVTILETCVNIFVVLAIFLEYLLESKSSLCEAERGILPLSFN